MRTTAPIACTLSPGRLADRLRWIAELNRTALRSYARDDLTLVLTYAPEAVARVRELADEEGRCCAFLSFRVDETPEEVRLTIVAPEAARRALDVALSWSLVEPILKRILGV